MNNTANNMDMNGYNIRNMVNSRRNEEQAYATNTVDMMNNSMNPNFMKTGTGNGTGNGNGEYQNEYYVDSEKYNAEMISQMQMEQAMNNYNNTASMPNTTMHEQNESASMHGMNSSMNPSGYESYRNLMNYNNTQNTAQTNQIPMYMNDMNNGESMYYNEQTGEVYPEEYLKNLMTTVDPATVSGFGGNFKMQNGNYNQMMQENYNNMQYPVPAFENMNNPQMFMQHQASLTPKQTRNIPLINAQQQHHQQQQQQQHMQAHMMPNMTPSMQPQIAPSTSLRKVPAVNRRKIKPKKFFPCC